MDKLFEPVKLTSKRIGVDSTIKNAIEIYRNQKIPLSRLISDYCIIMEHDTLVGKDNPWVYYHKGILKQSIESGSSVVEDAFNFGAIKLVAKGKEPTKVISAAFYANKSRNDSAFELSFLLPYFLDDFPASNILIVNPSPDIILYAEEFDDYYNDWPGLLEAFLRGIIFDFGTVKEAKEKYESLCALEEQAGQEIHETYMEVLEIAEDYGVDTTDYR